MLALHLLDADRPEAFPDPRLALAEPNGLLAVGGDLSVPRLVAAYRQGIFPWYNAGEPILWWSPDPRSVFLTGRLHLGRSLRRQLRGKHWRLTVDHDFPGVIRGCAGPRAGETGTWLVPEMIDAYIALHRAGHAHSVETWNGEHLIGGVYGVAVGRLFCGDSMFSRESGASKLALAGLGKLLAGLGFPLLDSQVINPHTHSLGAFEIPRAEYLATIADLTRRPGPSGDWRELTPRLIQPGAV